MITKVEFERIIKMTPGAKSINVSYSSNHTYVEISFRWYVIKRLRKAIINFLAETFTYLHLPGIVIHFLEKR